MSTPEDISSLNREELLALVAQLQGQIAALTATIEGLQAANAELQRSNKRQAAPFSKGSPVAQPKRPGRKPGSGTFSFRLAPHPSEITDPPVEVPVTLEACPGCGGMLAEERVDLAYITELPPLPRPRVTQYRVWSAGARPVAAKSEESTLIWPPTSTGPPPTEWGSGGWRQLTPSTTRSGFR